MSPPKPAIFTVRIKLPGPLDAPATWRGVLAECQYLTEAQDMARRLRASGIACEVREIREAG
jgi:hypothetical protein